MILNENLYFCYIKIVVSYYFVGYEIDWVVLRKESI